MVIRGKTHYSKQPMPIPNTKAEKNCGSGDVVKWQMTPEEVKEYFAKKYPNLERDRKMRNSKIW